MTDDRPSFDLVVWAEPRDVDDDGAALLVRDWLAAGADPRAAPFVPSTDIGWFHRELGGERPDLELVSDAVPSGSRTPIWLSSEDEPPARVVAIRLRPTTAPETLESILGLAVKYDLVLFDARRGRVHRPLAELDARATATFWPGGAIRSIVAGLVGLAIVVGAWLLAIPILSGLAIVVGAFLVVLTVVVLVDQTRRRLRGPNGTPAG